MWPSLILTYLGQAAFLTKHPEEVQGTYFRSLPHNVFWPMFVIASMSAIIASQVGRLAYLCDDITAVLSSIESESRCGWDLLGVSFPSCCFLFSSQDELPFAMGVELRLLAMVSGSAFPAMWGCHVITSVQPTAGTHFCGV